jgi:hypothetical protein
MWPGAYDRSKEEDEMIVVRDVYQARLGKTNELVTLLKEMQTTIAQGYKQRILSDASGQFFTVVLEIELPSLAEWEKARDQLFASPEFGRFFPRWQELVESGRREFYNLEG